VKKNIFNLALGNRNSRSSVKSDNSLRDRELPVKLEPSHPTPSPHPAPDHSPTTTATVSNGNSTASSDLKPNQDDEPRQDPKKKAAA
jgi:hypothetical protein